MKKQRARQRSAAQLVNRGVEWVWMSGCHLGDVTGTARNSAFASNRKRYKRHRPVFICPLRFWTRPYCQAAIIFCLADPERRSEAWPEDAALRATEDPTSKAVGIRSDQQMNVPLHNSPAPLNTRVWDLLLLLVFPSLSDSLTLNAINSFHSEHLNNNYAQLEVLFCNLSEEICHFSSLNLLRQNQ